VLTPKAALLRTAALEPADALLETRSLRNLRALRNLWAPTTDTPAKDYGWLMAAAEATALPAETLSTDDMNGEIVICKEDATTKWIEDVDLTTHRTSQHLLPPQRRAAWWDDAAINQMVAPLLQHPAAVTGWEAVGDHMYAHSALDLDGVPVLPIPSGSPSGVIASRSVDQLSMWAHAPLDEKHRRPSM